MPIARCFSINISTDSKNYTSISSRECVLVDDCDFYAWFIDNGDYGVPGFPKETVDLFLKRDECEVDQEGNIVKGK